MIHNHRGLSKHKILSKNLNLPHDKSHAAQRVKHWFQQKHFQRRNTDHLRQLAKTD